MCTDVRPADPKSPPSPPRYPGSPRTIPRRTGQAGSTAVSENRNGSPTTSAWPSGKPPQTVSTITAATVPARRRVSGRSGSWKPRKGRSEVGPHCKLVSTLGMRYGNSFRAPLSRSARADYQIVATRTLADIVEAVRDVGLEVQSISLPEQILLANEHRPQMPPFDNDVLLDAPAVRRKLAGSGALRDLVADEFDAPPDEVRREQLTLEACLGVAHDHTPLLRHDDDLTSLLHAGELRERHAKTLRQLRCDHERGVLLPTLKFGDHGPAHPGKLGQFLQCQASPPA